MTRAAPARLLGLTDRGHLGAGAIADIAVCRRDNDIAMFSARRARCSRTAIWWCEDGESATAGGRTLAQSGRPTRAMMRRLEDYHERALRAVARLVRLPRCRHIRARDALRRRAMPQLSVNGIAIDDTFAEAFGMRATAIVITAPHRKWAGRRRFR